MIWHYQIFSYTDRKMLVSSGPLKSNLNQCHLDFVFHIGNCTIWMSYLIWNTWKQTWNTWKTHMKHMETDMKQTWKYIKHTRNAWKHTWNTQNTHETWKHMKNTLKHTWKHTWAEQWSEECRNPAVSQRDCTTQSMINAPTRTHMHTDTHTLSFVSQGSKCPSFEVGKIDRQTRNQCTDRKTQLDYHRWPVENYTCNVVCSIFRMSAWVHGWLEVYIDRWKEGCVDEGGRSDGWG